jgi:hypothetical protein
MNGDDRVEYSLFPVVGKNGLFTIKFSKGNNKLRTLAELSRVLNSPLNERREPPPDPDKHE